METTEQQDSNVKIERFTRNLRVPLKEGEIVERAKRNAFLVGEIGQKADERDAAKKQANAQIEELEAEMQRLSLEVRDGATYRDIQCERRYVYRTGNVQEVRTDTGDVLNERSMTDRERQLELGVKDPAKGEPLTATIGEHVTPLPTEKKKRGRKPKNGAAEN